MSVKLHFAAVLLTATVAFAQGHPDLSGTWTFGIDLPPGDLVKVVDGKVTRTHWDGSTRHRVNEIPGALPWDKAPSYKPEFLEKVKFNAANESKVDPVFYCDKPGHPAHRLAAQDYSIADGNHLPI